MTRTLIWDGLENVRDLGGIPTEDGSSTRYGTFVRADNVRRLRDARTLVDYGDHAGRRPALPGRAPGGRARRAPRRGDARVAPRRVGRRLHRGAQGAHVGHRPGRVPALVVPRLPRPLPAQLRPRRRPDRRRAARRGVRPLRRRPRPHRPDLGARDAAGGRVGGRHRPRLRGERETRLAESHARWVAKAPDEQERAYRLVFAHAPAVVMEQVLAALEEEHGSVRDYLLAAGAEAAALDRLRARLRA